MVKRFLIVAGNIGAGKTSLTERLGERMGWQTGFESVSDNPYLADFYQDMATWSFHLQVFFLGHRAKQHLALANSSRSAIGDRSIYEDAHIFARVLHRMGNLSQRDYEAYRRVYDVVVADLPRPDLLIYVTAPVPMLAARIRRRGRAIEDSISEDYLSLLESLYQEWLDDFDICPILTIRTQHLDFVSKPQDLDVVIKRIEDKLSGHDEIILD